MINRFSKILLLIIIFIPAIPLITINGLASPLRVDYLLTIVFIFVFLSGVKNKFKIKLNIIIIITIIILIYALRSVSLVVSFGQLINYFSFWLSFIIGFSYFKNNNPLIKLLSAFLFFNILIHFFSIYFDYEIANNFVNGFGQKESDILFGRFGIAKMPFQFVIYVASFFFLNLLFRPSITRLSLLLLISLGALLTGESRIGLGAFICSILFLYPLACLFIAAPALALLPISEKMSHFLEFNGDSIFFDPSLGMRLNNFFNYLDCRWLSR